MVCMYHHAQPDPLKLTTSSKADFTKSRPDTVKLTIQMVCCVPDHTQQSWLHWKPTKCCKAGHKSGKLRSWPHTGQADHMQQSWPSSSLEIGMLLDPDCWAGWFNLAYTNSKTMNVRHPHLVLSNKLFQLDCWAHIYWLVHDSSLCSILFVCPALQPLVGFQCSQLCCVWSAMQHTICIVTSQCLVGF